MVRVVRWLRREDLYHLVSVSKQVREGILLQPIGLGFGRPIVEKKNLLKSITRVISGGDTDGERDGCYQISPHSPISPLKIKVGSMIISHSPGIENGGGPHAEHPEARSSGVYFSGRPWSDSGEFIAMDHALEDDTPSPPDSAEYAERLGRLVWLLTLTARCKSRHRELQGKEMLKFCIWCGECVCAVCLTHPNIFSLPSSLL
ncbi:hypothetical protein EV426DRAFT_292828 [Tirmania nivea]|nr:hypothetical protein EV426DRAFT_292828 [Tirmania nivea]